MLSRPTSIMDVVVRLLRRRNLFPIAFLRFLFLEEHHHTPHHHLITTIKHGKVLARPK
jgi:hypothetical protein